MWYFYKFTDRQCTGTECIIHLGIICLYIALLFLINYITLIINTSTHTDPYQWRFTGDANCPNSGVDLEEEHYYAIENFYTAFSKIGITGAMAGTILFSYF